LDYYKNYSKGENQLILFASLIKLAKDLDLPMVIHSRQASADTLRILKENLPLRAVLHCFSGDENFLKECLDLGFYISFTCNITYKKADNLRQMVKLTPSDRLMLETDAPFLSPEQLRGRRNEPLNVQYLAEEVAKIRGEALDQLSLQTTSNAKAFFKLK
jgi:TatD DNase family protein